MCRWTSGGAFPKRSRRHATVAFIGNDIRNRFFEAAIRSARRFGVEGVPYEVVGVAKALGSVFGQSQDNFVMIPIESYFKTYGVAEGHPLGRQGDRSGRT